MVGFSQEPFASTQNGWEERRSFFQKNGYLWIKQFYSPDQVLLLKDWADQIHQSSLTLAALSKSSGLPLQILAQKMRGSLIVVPEAGNPSQICRAEDLLSCYPDLHQFVFGTLTTYLTTLLNEPYTLFKDKINFKWPGGGAFPPHQDFPAFEFFGPREHVSVMVCIDRATLENGCLHIAQNWRETFRGMDGIDPQLLENGTAVLPYIVGGKNHGTIQPLYADKISWLPIEAAPGDVVFFNSYIPHYSEPNRSDAPRRAMFFTHNRLKEGEYRETYYYTKRADPDNPAFHFATPTMSRMK